VILPCGKKSLFWSLIILVIWVWQRSGDKKIGFNDYEFIQFLNNANFHAFHVWGKRILSCIDTFFLHFFSFFCFCNATFSTPVTSTNLRNQSPLFTELRLLQGTSFVISGQTSVSHNSAADWARELFKPFKDSWSLVV